MGIPLKTGLFRAKLKIISIKTLDELYIILYSKRGYLIYRGESFGINILYYILYTVLYTDDVLYILYICNYTVLVYSSWDICYDLHIWGILYYIMYNMGCGHAACYHIIYNYREACV